MLVFRLLLKHGRPIRFQSDPEPESGRSKLHSNALGAGTRRRFNVRIKRKICQVFLYNRTVAGIQKSQSSTAIITELALITA